MRIDERETRVVNALMNIYSGELRKAIRQFSHRGMAVKLSDTRFDSGRQNEAKRFRVVHGLGHSQSVFPRSIGHFHSVSSSFISK